MCKYLCSHPFSRSILHDTEVFSEPEEYKPERYLKDGKLNADARSPHVAAFGYGRRPVRLLGRCFCPHLPASRICPGRHFSDDSLFILIALVLSVFNIDPPVDEHGNAIKLTPGVTGGALSCVIFQCLICKISFDIFYTISATQSLTTVG